jgi:hypothetical protein
MKTAVLILLHLPLDSRLSPECVMPCSGEGCSGCYLNSRRPDCASRFYRPRFSGLFRGAAAGRGAQVAGRQMCSSATPLSCSHGSRCFGDGPQGWTAPRPPRFLITGGSGAGVAVRQRFETSGVSILREQIRVPGSLACQRPLSICIGRHARHARRQPLSRSRRCLTSNADVMNCAEGTVHGSRRCRCP